MWDEHLRQHGNKSKLLDITKNTCVPMPFFLIPPRRGRDKVRQIPSPSHDPTMTFYRIATGLVHKCRVGAG
eukprot:scaffold30836_cov83-Skeletonema_dohrnii-CCMP3373.AAC.1